MPPTGKKEYYAFISYNHKDALWAERLYQDLIAKGIPKEAIFKDNSSLRTGDLWEPQLIAALNASSYLVVLWSTNAQKTQWVNNELANFDASLNKPGAEEIKVRQHMIFISLDNENEPYKHIQMNHKLRLAEVYDPANPTLEKLLHDNKALWEDVVEDVFQAITRDEVTVPIPLLVFATTRDRLDKDITFSQKPEFSDFSEPLESLVSNTIKIGTTKDELLARYGPKRTDWKPIVENNTTVGQLLIELRDHVNNISKSQQIRWAPVDEAFWGDDAGPAKTIADGLTSGLALIVIDPISLYDPLVFRRLNLLIQRGCFDNENAVFLVLSPFSMPLPNVGFRKLIQDAASFVFDDYYQPGVRRIPYARCSINFGDDMGMRRPLIATLYNFFHQTTPSQVPVQTSVGAKRVG